jgi:hypothetical protein
MGNYLIDILQEHKAGKPVGIYSVCSANQFVLEAAMVKAKRENTALLIESTSNQVDQFGGYSGMNPEQFVEYVHEISDRMKFPFEMIILGETIWDLMSGKIDHPIRPWRLRQIKYGLMCKQDLLKFTSMPACVVWMILANQLNL